MECPTFTMSEKALEQRELCAGYIADYKDATYPAAQLAAIRDDPELE